jgi:hypothetical protein
VRAARPHAAAMGEGFRGFAQSWYLEQPNWQLLEMSYAVSVSLPDKIKDKIVGFHDATRLTTLRDSAMPGPLTPRRKGTVNWR